MKRITVYQDSLLRGITWGGHQDARDGGMDVVVRGETPPPQNSFVPRSITGFQVKKPDIPRAEILKEMQPNGILREEIKTLIQERMKRWGTELTY